MELAERKEMKQKELDALALKHRKLMEYIAGLKKKSLALDQEICELTEKRAALQNRQAANKVADEFDQYKRAFRPEKSTLEKPISEEPEPISSESVESCVPEPSPDGEAGKSPEMPEEALETAKQKDVPQENAEKDGWTEEGSLPEAALPANYVMTQKELLELVRSISQREQSRPEEIVVRKVSAGAKMLEIFHDIVGKIFLVFVFGLLTILLSLALTVLANGSLRNALLEFIRNVGV